MLAFGFAMTDSIEMNVSDHDNVRQQTINMKKHDHSLGFGLPPLFWLQ